jgi:FMN phosphatase YigB (HAD superfamily)
MNSNTIYFDLDGTLVDTYSDIDWQSKLVDQDVSIFLNPPSLVDAHEFTQIIHKLQDNG